MRFEPDGILLRRYHAAMARGDLPAAAAAWDQLAVNNFDRIKQTVKLFRFSAGGGGIPDFDQGSAVSAAYLRVRAMGAHFRKQEIEAYYAALVHTVQHSCRDFGRKEFRHTKRKAGSLDERFDPESEVGPFDQALASWEADRRRQSAEAVTDELHKQW
ncbi:MAG TPA: hypothetical protein VE570_11135, partial [Thermoleophilaceae bacterium]|nr:hypothetical protein [Thermoleophilaceae bacterium]